MNNNEVIEKIQDWIRDRNLHTQDPRVQMCKTMEELGELANAINASSDKEACKVMEQTENPFGENYKTNSINNPFGDIM